MTALNDIVPAGVVTGDDMTALMEYCREHEFALPAVNVTRYVCSNSTTIQQESWAIIVWQVRCAFSTANF